MPKEIKPLSLEFMMPKEIKPLSREFMFVSNPMDRQIDLDATIDNFMGAEVKEFSEMDDNELKRLSDVVKGFAQRAAKYNKAKAEGSPLKIKNLSTWYTASPVGTNTLSWCFRG